MSKSGKRKNANAVRSAKKNIDAILNAADADQPEWTE
jgi:hypothetical protein